MYHDLSSSEEEGEGGEDDMEIDDDKDIKFDGDSTFLGDGANRPKSHDYEMFIYGFFYFFILQDPFIR